MPVHWADPSPLSGPSPHPAPPLLCFWAEPQRRVQRLPYRVESPGAGTGRWRDRGVSPLGAPLTTHQGPKGPPSRVSICVLPPQPGAPLIVHWCDGSLWGVSSPFWKLLRMLHSGRTRCAEGFWANSTLSPPLPAPSLLVRPHPGSSFEQLPRFPKNKAAGQSTAVQLGLHLPSEPRLSLCSPQSGHVIGGSSCHFSR